MFRNLVKNVFLFRIKALLLLALGVTMSFAVGAAPTMDKTIYDKTIKLVQLQEELYKSNNLPIPKSEVVLRSSMPLYTMDNGVTVWLHTEVLKWWDIFKQEQKTKSWTTDAKEGGNPVIVREITAWMYGFWDGGNNTTQKTVKNASSVETDTKTQNDFPFPRPTRDQTCGRSWTKGPIIEGNQVCF